MSFKASLDLFSYQIICRRINLSLCLIEKSQLMYRNGDAHQTIYLLSRGAYGNSDSLLEIAMVTKLNLSKVKQVLIFIEHHFAFHRLNCTEINYYILTSNCS